MKIKGKKTFREKRSLVQRERERERERERIRETREKRSLVQKEKKKMVRDQKRGVR